MPEPDRVFMNVTETEDTITIGRREFENSFRSRMDYDRQKVLDQAIRAWRTNPMARRIVEITTQFVIGDGLSFECKQPRAEKFIKAFWEHDLNRLDEQFPEWADETWRSGDLFILFSVDPAGMSYVRAIPAEIVTNIETSAADYRQETAYSVSAFDAPIPAYDKNNPAQSFIIHFALNRAAGTFFGESDLAPVLYWIGLYKQWLEDRARLNYFRQMFAYFVEKAWKSPEEKAAYAAKLRADPPKPGSINLIDPGENWGIINPVLSAFDAEIDGLALKKMVAVGVGMPLHFLAEPESSTKSTAEAAGTPTYKRFEARQVFFTTAIQRICETAYQVRRTYDSTLPKDLKLKILSPDISERDNAGLAIAASTAGATWKNLYEQGLVDEKEYMRIVYQFAGQTAPDDIPTEPKSRLPEPTRAASPQNPVEQPAGKSPTDISPAGDVTVKAEAV
jgi:hypothetical protein